MLSAYDRIACSCEAPCRSQLRFSEAGPPHFSAAVRFGASYPVARLPDKENENNNQHNDDEHPVLAFETQKVEIINEEMHRSCSRFLVQGKRFSDRNILFLYFRAGQP